MLPNRYSFTKVLVALVCYVSLAATQAAPAQKPDQAPQQKPAAPLDDRALAAALCPIVYQVDRSPSPRGYHYLFYGNGFFINQGGYVITAAHVLSQLHGGQPYLLLRSRAAPPRFVQAAVVALDRDHDIALLLASPNPFHGNYTVAFLPLTRESPVFGETVLAADLRPFKPRDSYTLEPALEERSSGKVLDFEFSQLEKGRPDTELFLFSHSVEPGQSGAPVISLASQQVVGLIEGQWLRDNDAALAAPKQHLAQGYPATSASAEVAPLPGAVIPIHYAIALLRQKAIAWHTASEDARGSEQDETEQASPPAPLSLIPPPYPAQSLFGGEVALDALVGPTGALSDVRVVRGEQPFLEKALAAVRTWTFFPARSAGHTVEARIAVVFQFSQPHAPKRSATVRQNDAPPVAPLDSAALPLATVEPEYPDASSAAGSIILYGLIDLDGHLGSLKVVRGLEPLTPAALAAVGQWHFAPAKKAGAAIDSTAVIVVTFRRPLVTSHAPQ
jgi:TonB family protein